MSTCVKIRPATRSVQLLSVSTFATGICGMAMSYVFLSSNHHLDVLAGAAGFVAGSIFVSGSLVAIAFLTRTPKCEGPQETCSAPAPVPAVNFHRWLAHFTKNRECRPEPAWNAPVALAAEVVQPLVRSLEQFQLGDGGGPAYLIAWDRETFLARGEGMRELVDLWFTEEREHSRLLGAAVARFGGRCIHGHWSFTAFCWSRRRFGVRFELTVLLLTEIVSTVYYRLIRRHANDSALRSMCRLILRDENCHVAFHRDRLATAARNAQARYGTLWEIWFRALGLAAATMLWVNHAPGLRALGANGREFYREVWRELSRFIRRLRLESLKEPTSRHGSAQIGADQPPPTAP
jgi:hypothetical protein